MVTGDRTFRKAVGIITLGMMIPAFPVALAGDLVVASLSYRVFLGLVAVAYGVIVVVLLDWLSLDRLTFIFTSLVWPWIVFFTTLFGILILNEGEQIPRGPIANIVRTLYGNHWIWGTETPGQVDYAAVFMITGIIAVAISSFLQRKGRHLVDHLS